jgi:hypothetical protein
MIIVLGTRIFFLHLLKKKKKEERRKKRISAVTKFVLCVRVCVLLLRDQSCMDLVKLFDA